MKKFVSIMLALAMSISLAACSADSSSDASSDSRSSPDAASGEKVVKIGVFEPATGDSGAGGKQEMLGMQYANHMTPPWTSAARLERNSRTVGGVLCRPHAGLTGCNRNVKSRDERRLMPPPLTSPRSAVIFVEKAAAACAAPALKYFCSILHHNLAFTQNLGQTPLQLEVKALNDVGSVAQSTLCPSFQAIEYSCPEFGSLIFAIVSQ